MCLFLVYQSLSAGQPATDESLSPADREQLLLAAAADAREKEFLDKIRADSLCLAGTDTACSTLEQLYPIFHEKFPNTPSMIYYTGGGNDVGFREYFDHRAEAVVVCWEPQDDEKSQMEKIFPDPNQRPEEIVFSKSALIIIVHKSNPIPALTYKQIEDIYREDIPDWSSLLGVKTKIKRIGTTYPTLSWGMFKRQILKGKRVQFPEEKIPRDYKKKEKRSEAMARDAEMLKRNPGGGPYPMYLYDHKVVEEVGMDKNAIGYCILPSADYKFKNVRVVPIIPPGGTEPVSPTRENVLFDKYPLQVTIKFLVRPDASQTARDFIKFVCSDEMADKVRECGLHPISEREQIHLRRRLADYKAGHGPRVLVMGLRNGQPLMQDLVLDYVKAKAVVQLSYSTTTGGIVPVAQFLQGQREVLLLDGPPSGDAMRVHGAKWRQVNPQEHILAGRAVAVVVHATNKLDSLTIPQVRGIFKGDISDWRLLAAVGDQTMADTRIHRYGVRHASKTAELFHRIVMEGKKTDPLMHRMTTEKVLSSLSTDPQGIGFLGAGQLPPDPAKAGLKVLAILSISSLGASGETKPVLPTSENVLNGQYPIAERLHLYVSPKASQTTQDFVTYITTPGNSMETFQKHELLPKPIPPVLAPPTSQPTVAPTTQPTTAPTSQPTT